MTNNRYDNINYVDHVGYEVIYQIGERDMGVLRKGQIYWHFNGLMLLGVI